MSSDLERRISTEPALEASRRGPLVLVFLLALALPIVACSDPSADLANATREALEARAEAYWRLRETLDLRGCFSFYEPAFRERYTVDSFAEAFARLNRFDPVFLRIESVSIRDSDRGAREAAVRIELRIKPDVLEGEELVTVHEETWRWEEGNWWKGSEPLMPGA